MKRPRKITLESTLSHVDDDFAGHCGRRRIVSREEVIDLGLPMSTRLHELETLFKCARCGRHEIPFQCYKRGQPFTDLYRQRQPES